MSDFDEELNNDIPENPIGGAGPIVPKEEPTVLTPQLILDTIRLYIPSGNIIEDGQILDIAQKMINKYGDDLNNIGVVSCETLKANGAINKSLSMVDESGILSERVGDHSVTYASVVDFDPWDRYLKSLDDYICPVIFGVKRKVTFGAKVHSGDKKPIIKPCGYRGGSC